MANKSIVVIGAGIAGLTAAYQLKKAGQDVLVLDMNNYAGGRLANVMWEGFLLTKGASFVTTADKSTSDLLQELGLGDQLIKSKEGFAISTYRDGKLHSVNFLSIPSYLGWSGVSFKARMAMLKLLPYLLKPGMRENIYHMERAAGPDTDETFEQFFKARISDEMFEQWANPVFEWTCAYKGDDLSRKAFLTMMSSYMNAAKVTFRDGIGTLPKALAGRLEVELSADVKQIVPQADGSGISVTYTVDGRAKTARADRVVVAVQGNHVLPLLADLRPAWQQFFPKVAYSSGARHYHIAETDYEPPVKLALIPRTLKEPIARISFEKYKDGRWLMLTSPSAYTFNADQDPDDLAAQAQAVMSTVFPALAGMFRGHRVFKWRDKVPTFRPGYLDALKHFWEDPQENPVYFCGDYLSAPGVSAALYTGMECAGRVLKSI
jgi:oxygen-dependent protoporphyrinogen oxidase